MIETEIIAFVLVALLATFSPGPAVLLAVYNGANHGFKIAVIGIFGNVLAMVFYASLASLGLGFLIKSGGNLVFHIMQILGGLYLVYLGYKSTFSKNNSKDKIADYNKPSKRTVFFTAITVGLSNPKAIIFFSVLFPPFINISSSYLLQAILLTSIFASCSLIALSFYAILAAKLLNKNGIRALSRVNKAAGILFMFIGGGLVYSAVYN